jgi:hypothetical protein
MIRTALILALVAFCDSGVQTTSEDVRNTVVDQMCGRVTVEHKSSSSKMRSEEIYGAVVRVYPRPKGSSCCANLPLLAESRSGFYGSFRFKKEKKMPEGDYWLTVELKKTNKEYALPVRLFRVKGSSDAECDTKVFEIKISGELILVPYVDID